MKIPSIPLGGRIERNAVGRPAFTLVELIVVVATVALLAALLLPAMAGTKREDRSAVCLSNLRQIGVGMAMYAAENEDTLHFRGDPSFPSIPNHGQWTAYTRSQSLDMLSATNPYAYWGIPYFQYVGRTREIFRCPSARTVDEWREDGLNYPTEFWLTSSYGINRYVVEWPDLSQAPRHLSNFTDPAKMIAVQDSAEQKMEGVDDTMGLFPGNSEILGQWRFGLAGVYPGLRMELEWYRHDMNGNTLWLDGHVSRIPFTGFDVGIDYRYYTGETPVTPIPGDE